MRVGEDKYGFAKFGTADEDIVYSRQHCPFSDEGTSPLECQQMLVLGTASTNETFTSKGKSTFSET